MSGDRIGPFHGRTLTHDGSEREEESAPLSFRKRVTLVSVHCSGGISSTDCLDTTPLTDIAATPQSAMETIAPV
jgi:hypothetical protein